MRQPDRLDGKAAADCGACEAEGAATQRLRSRIGVQVRDVGETDLADTTVLLSMGTRHPVWFRVPTRRLPICESPRQW